MPEPSSELHFDEFVRPDQEAWQKAVSKGLKGNDPAKLKWEVFPGLKLDPYYPHSEAKGPYRRGYPEQTANWQVVQAIDLADLSTASTLMEVALTQEVVGLHLFHQAGKALPLREALKDLPMDRVALHLQSGEDPVLLATDLYLLLNQQGISPQQLTGTLQFDPIGRKAALGKAADAADYVACEGGLRSLSRSPHFRALGLDLSYVKELGGTPVQELAFGLATVVDYLVHFGWMESDISPGDLLQNLAITFPVGGYFFPDLAKFRAWRMLFAQLLEAMGHHDAALQQPFLLASSSRRFHSRLDLPNNLLRLSTAAMAAVMGGAQALLLWPHDHIKGTSSPESARWARNIQHLLRYESHLDQVLDPAGGAHYIEQLTDQLARQAWELFQQIERRGGFSAAIRSGQVQAWLQEARNWQEASLARGQQRLVGVNESPAPEVPTDPAPALPFSRLAEPFEALRQQMEAHVAAGHARPAVYLLPFGQQGPRQARLQFSRELLRMGGFAVIEGEADNLTPDLSNPTIQVVVLCSADEQYFEQGPAILEGLRQGAPHLMYLLAGHPVEWQQSGADAVLYAGMDQVEFLSTLQHISFQN